MHASRKDASGGGVTEIFAGIRVLDVAQNTFGPAAAGVLADFGADVIKVEHPVRGDPQRGLVTAAMQPSIGGVNLGMAQVNRGKRSIGLDLTSLEGSEVLAKLVRSADVFLTNCLPATAAKLGIAEETIRATNPRIVYARASGFGPRGPHATERAYDSTAYWARSGIAASLARGDTRPPSPLPAFGDRVGAMNLAFGIAAALLRRERTGEGACVDVSLLGTALWQNSSTTVYSMALGEDWRSRSATVTNPLSATYETSDHRWLTLAMLESDRFWGDFCEKIGGGDLVDDPRFSDSAARTQHAAALVSELDKIFAGATLSEWRERFASLEGAWAPYLTSLEAVEDPQVLANGYVVSVEQGNGLDVRLLPPPVQFDGAPPVLRRAPEFAEHGEEILLEFGYSWDDIVALHDAKVIT
jgi:crotonobetainyl-CoA:carnitine CoA-transferase CaiB-like acyl-CoA transferase